MDKKYTDEQCYIVSLDNGIRREEPVSIDVINSFKDNSQLVQLNKTVFGVFKSNSLKPETMYIDDYDIIKSDIAELLDIDHEEIKRIVTEDKTLGIFTTLNYSKDIETRISASTVIKHIIEYVNKGLLSEEESSWIKNVLQYQNGTKENTITDENQIEDIIRFGMYSLIKEVELQAGQALDPKVKRAIEKKYIRMILFDYVIGRKYRGLDYYLISKINENGKPVWIDSYLSPISVSNSLERDSQIGDNAYQLNNKVINRDALIKVLFDRFYSELRKLTEAIKDAQKLYDDAIVRIIYNNTDINAAIQLEKVVIANLEKIAGMQKDIESKLDKEQKQNKVERTMATQSFNVRVTTKLDLIQKRYPINPKDHPELLEKAKKAQTSEDIKLIVEEENKSKSGFAATSVLISAISLICGIGIGIAYVLMTFGN